MARAWEGKRNKKGTLKGSADPIRMALYVLSLVAVSGLGNEVDENAVHCCEVWTVESKYGSGREGWMLDWLGCWTYPVMKMLNSWI
jgi:hypothetical protein